MTLQEKLKELGYQLIGGEFSYKKREDTTTYIFVKYGEITYAGVSNRVIKTQKQIDNLQVAFNNLKRDLKELKTLEVPKGEKI